MDCCGSRPRRTGADRRKQQVRAEGRLVQRLLKCFVELDDHRGCAASRLGRALAVALRAAHSAPAMSPTTELVSGEAFGGAVARGEPQVQHGTSMGCPHTPVVAPDLGEADTAAVDVQMDLAEESQQLGQITRRVLRRARVRVSPSGVANTVGFATAGQLVRGCPVVVDGRCWLSLTDGGGFILERYGDGEAILEPA